MQKNLKGLREQMIEVNGIVDDVLHRLVEERSELCGFLGYRQ